MIMKPDKRIHEEFISHLHMIHVVIVPASTIKGGGWDLDNCKVLFFHNFRKLIYFAEYYSRTHDVLVEIYTDNVWFATYCKGDEICNCF